MDPKMLLKAGVDHRVPVRGMLFAPLTDVHLARALQGDLLEVSGGKYKLRDVAGMGGPPCSTPGS